ncbi:hypothetical protein AB0M44_04985 [Streptosporangium subroseum]
MTGDHDGPGTGDDDGPGTNGHDGPAPCGTLATTTTPARKV